MKDLLERYCHFFGRPQAQQGAVVSYSIATVVFSSIIIFLLQGFYLEAKKEYQAQVALIDWLNQNRAHLTRASRPDQTANSGLIKKDNRTLVVLLSETAVDNKLALSRLEQRQSKVTVNLNEASFKGLITWLATLADHGVNLGQANISYIENNIANATLTFTKD